MKKDVTQELANQFGDAVTPLETFRGELSFMVEPSRISEVAEFLRDAEGLEFKMLVDIAGIDYYPVEDPGRFALSYHLLSIRWNSRIRLKVFWSDGDAPVQSMTSLWLSADWEEREAHDMFGIEFSGHPDMRRLLMPEDWEGFPQRRDYPLGYETVQFSFNTDEIDKYKPYAKE
jgi:NADH-quinone oxidoreductase subunit C